jgi:hypothetical protein
MVTRVFVHYARSYNFTDKETGRGVNGVAVQYSMPDMVPEEGQLGHKVLNGTLPVTELGNLTQVPGLYDAGLSITVKDNKPVMKLASVTLAPPSK